MRYYWGDHLGSTRVVTDDSGNVCYDADYYPFQGERAYVTTCAPAYRFAGMKFDQESSDYYTLNRYYPPNLGRWLTPDPLAGDISNPQSLNRYAYVTNNPTNFIDPLGLDGCPQMIESWEGGERPECDNAPGPAPPPLDASIPSPEGWPTFLPQAFGGLFPGFFPGYTPQRPSTSWDETYGTGTDTFTVTETFTGCGGPTGIQNIATNCGTQIGDDLKTIPKYYMDMVNTSTMIITYEAADGSRWTVTVPSGFQVWYQTFAFGPTDINGPAFPNPFYSSPRPSCVAAAQNLTTWIATHPGKSPPASLTGGFGPACSGL